MNNVNNNQDQEFSYSSLYLAADVTLNVIGSIPFPPLSLAVGFVENAIFSIMMVINYRKRTNYINEVDRLQRELGVEYEDINRRQQIVNEKQHSVSTVGLLALKQGETINEIQKKTLQNLIQHDQRLQQSIVNVTVGEKDHYHLMNNEIISTHEDTENLRQEIVFDLQNTTQKHNECNRLFKKCENLKLGIRYFIERIFCALGRIFLAQFYVNFVVGIIVAVRQYYTYRDPQPVAENPVVV